MHFPASLPGSVLVVHQNHVLLLSPDTSSRDATPFSPPRVLLSTAFSPVLEASDGKKRGGLCAVLGSGQDGAVALMGLDKLERCVQELYTRRCRIHADDKHTKVAAVWHGAGWYRVYGWCYADRLE